MTQFFAAAGIKNPHLQTLLPRFIRKKALFTPIWQTLDTDDGDFLDLAWSEDPTKEPTQNKPIFVLFHGLEGCFYSPYANGLMNAFAKSGWLSVMMHFRGCSGKPNKKSSRIPFRRSNGRSLLFGTPSSALSKQSKSRRRHLPWWQYAGELLSPIQR